MSAIETPLLAKARPLTLADVEPPGHTLLVAFVFAFAVIYTCLSFYLVCLATALAWLPVGLGLQLIWRCGSSKSASPMAPKDRIWLCDTPTQPMIVNAVLVFEAPRLKLDRVTELVQERIIGHPALGRFSQLLQRDRRSPTGYVWATDPDFDLRRHIGEAVGEGACEAALDEVALQAWLGRRFSEPLPRDRPLWCVELLDCDGGTALVFRCHHAVGDGIAMSSVLLEALLEDFEERSEAIRGTQGPSEPIRARSALPEDSDAMCPAVPEEPFRPFRPSVSSEGCVSSVAPPEEPFRPFLQGVSSEECVSSVESVSSVAVPEETLRASAGRGAASCRAESPIDETHHTGGTSATTLMPATTLVPATPLQAARAAPVLTKGTVTTVTTVASSREAPVGLARALVVLLVAILLAATTTLAVTSSRPQLVENEGIDCWSPCGNRSGACPGFCGAGGACCRPGRDKNNVACRFGTLESAVCPKQHCCVAAFGFSG